MTSHIDANSLTDPQKIALACCLIEKMLPNYALFAELTGFGDAELLRNISSLAWESILATGSKINFEKQADKLADNIPEESDFEMYGVYPAIDCCVGVEILLSMLVSGDFSELDELQRLYFATVESYLALQDESVDPKQQPLYQDAVDYVAAISALLDEGADVAEFKALAGQSKTSNLGLSLSE